MRYLVDRALVIAIGTIIYIVGFQIYVKNFTREAHYRHIQRIYDELWTKTGQTQEKIPLRIVDSSTINAYNNGKEIVLYTGLLDSTKTWDEVALILGHEIAHGNLWHLRMISEWKVATSDYEVSVLEANADKLGALYIMQAGYDVCKGREWFKTMAKLNGDYQGGNHPGYAYRYTQLNVNCD